MLASHSPLPSPITTVFGRQCSSNPSSRSTITTGVPVPPSSPRTVSSPADCAFANALAHAIRQGQQQQQQIQHNQQQHPSPSKSGLKRPWPSSRPQTPSDDREMISNAFPKIPMVDTSMARTRTASAEGSVTSESSNSTGTSSGLSYVSAETHAGRAEASTSTSTYGEKENVSASSSEHAGGIGIGGRSAGPGWEGHGKRRKVSNEDIPSIPTIAFPTSPDNDRGSAVHSPKSNNISITLAVPSPPRLRAPSAPNATLVLPPGSKLAERRQLNKKHLSLTVPPASLLSVKTNNIPISPTTGAPQTRSAPGSPRLPVTAAEQIDTMKQSLRGTLSMRRRTSLPGLPKLSIRPPVPGGGVGGGPPTAAIGTSSSSRPSAVEKGASAKAQMRLLRTDESRSYGSDERERPAMTEEFPYARGPRLILPGVWLGSEHNAGDVDSLAELGIGTILNVAKEVECPWGEGKEMIEEAEDAGVGTIAEEDDSEGDGAREVLVDSRATPSGSSLRLKPALNSAWSHSSAGSSTSSFASTSNGLRPLKRLQPGLSRSANPPPAHSSDARLRTPATSTFSQASATTRTSLAPGDSPSRGLVVRTTSSTPNLQASFKLNKAAAPAANDSLPVRHYPRNSNTGRPALDYLWLPWTHDQEDLVAVEFDPAFKFIDEARKSGRGVLIHCQCGVSRSATLIIGYVMRQAARAVGVLAEAEPAGVDPQEKAALANVNGMHAAYSYVKDRSEYIGPNIGLVYQLVEYERALAGNSNEAAQNSASSSGSHTTAPSLPTFPSEEEIAASKGMDVDEPVSQPRRDFVNARMAYRHRSPTSSSISSISEESEAPLSGKSTDNADSSQWVGARQNSTANEASRAARTGSQRFGHQQTASEPDGLGRASPPVAKPPAPKKTPLRPMQLRTISSDEILSASNEALDLHGTPQRAASPSSAGNYLLPLPPSQGTPVVSASPEEVPSPPRAPLEAIIDAQKPTTSTATVAQHPTFVSAELARASAVQTGAGASKLRAVPSGTRGARLTSTPAVGALKLAPAISLQMPVVVENNSPRDVVSPIPVFGAATQSRSERRAAHRRAFSADLQTLLAKNLTVADSEPEKKVGQ